MKVLIVDDSDAMRKVLKRTLQACGWRLLILEARSVAQAIKVMKAERPHLILTDWVMPSISGLDFVRSLTRIGLNIPIGMVTANASPNQVQEAMLAGAAFVIGKPFTADILKEALTPFVIGIELESMETGKANSKLELNSLISSNIAQIVEVTVRKNEGRGCAINGSAGAVFTYLSEGKRVRYLLAMDWPLASYLAAAFAGLGSDHAERTIAARRFQPQEQAALREVANILRSALGEYESAPLELGQSSYRGDGTLRSDYWQQLIGGRVLQNSEETRVELILDGYGGGDLSLFELAF